MVQAPVITHMLAGPSSQSNPANLVIKRCVAGPLFILWFVLAVAVAVDKSTNRSWLVSMFEWSALLDCSSMMPLICLRAQAPDVWLPANLQLQTVVLPGPFRICNTKDIFYTVSLANSQISQSTLDAG